VSSIVLISPLIYPTAGFEVILRGSRLIAHDTLNLAYRHRRGLDDNAIQMIKTITRQTRTSRAELGGGGVGFNPFRRQDLNQRITSERLWRYTLSTSSRLRHSEPSEGLVERIV
jgi:hypothetical protein